MSANMIALVGLIYLGIGATLLYEKKLGLAIAFFGYAFSNVGLYIAAQPTSSAVVVEQERNCNESL